MRQMFGVNGSLKTIIRTMHRDIVVSTIFLCIDHGFFNNKPLLFETMVFGSDKGEDQYRYCTIQEARLGHAELCGKHFNTAPWVD